MYKRQGEKATIQLAFNTPAAGPNGIGGITVDGTTSGVQMKTDKKGNVMYEMNVQGVAVSARVTFRMAKGTNCLLYTSHASDYRNHDWLSSFFGYFYLELLFIYRPGTCVRDVGAW